MFFGYFTYATIWYTLSILKEVAKRSNERRLTACEKVVLFFENTRHRKCGFPPPCTTPNSGLNCAQSLSSVSGGDGGFIEGTFWQ